jgi:hypothetical protein
MSAGPPEGGSKIRVGICLDEPQRLDGAAHVMLTVSQFAAARESSEDKGDYDNN